MRLRSPLAVYRLRRLQSALGPQLAGVEDFLVSRRRTSAAGGGPVYFFNASTRIHTLSLNAAFSLIASWAVRAVGQEVLQLVCHAAMDPCVLGTNRRSPESAPPCQPCLSLSRTLYPTTHVLPLTSDVARAVPLRRELEGLPLEALAAWEADGFPLGAMTLPSVRWILRRHRLEDSDMVRRLFAGYLASAAGLADSIQAIFSRTPPKALVVFNGIFYPEAVARRVAQGLGIPVVTHEVGLRPQSAFFSHQEATFRDVNLPSGILLSPAQDAQLDEVLRRRFRGEFTMAGVRFWPEIAGLPARLTAKRRDFRQMVSVFTNVVFDTSQVHANVLFEDMFAWLDELALTMRKERETLFVIRAHPDENRTGKESQESVAAWFRDRHIDGWHNVLFIGPEEPISSYELIQASNFVLVYNSSVGLEASILGTPALCAGRARFTQIEAAYVPPDREAYWHRLREFLTAAELDVPAAQVKNARAFLYYELFQSSLDLGEFLVPDPGLQGMVRFSDFRPARLVEAEACQVIRQGILDGKAFVLPSPELEAGGVAADIPQPMRGAG